MSYTRPQKQEKIWNQWDEIALLVGLRRIPGESNIGLRNRILNHGRYDSTFQGLTNYISDALITDTYNVRTKSCFFSLRQPLSRDIFQSLGSSETYSNPQIIGNGNTWTIAPSSNDIKDESNYVAGITWTLWKQPDGYYDMIWTSSIPVEFDIELRYQWNDDGVIYSIQEKPQLYTWSRGSIIEGYPEGTNQWE